jgi:small subunit ribosomal protein S3
VEIERAANRVNVSIHTAKPGMVIGKGGSEVEALRKELNNLTNKRVHINVVEIKKPDLDAHLVGESVAEQLENRIAFRRAMRGAMQRTMRAGAKGIKIQVAGRLNGADMSRIESYSDGDCSFAHASRRYRLLLGRSSHYLRGSGDQDLDLPW